MNLPAGRDLLAAAVAAKDVNPGITGVLQEPQHALMGQTPPDESAVPGAPVSPLGKVKPVLGKMLDHAIGAPFLSEQSKDQTHTALNLPIRIQHDTILGIISEAHRQGKA